MFIKTFSFVSALCRVNDMFYTVLYMTVNMLVKGKYDSVSKSNFSGEETSVR